MALRSAAPSVSRCVLTDGGAELAITPEQAHAVLEAGPQALTAMGLSLTLKRAAGSLAAVPTLRSGNVIGGARFVSDRHVVELTIGPKVGTANILQIMEFCGDPMVPPDAGTSMASAPGHPVALVVEYVAREVRRFLDRPPFRDYLRVNDAAARRPRGRLNAEQLMTHTWPRMQWNVLPCSYFDFTADVPENRILAATVEAAGRLSVLLPADARVRVRDHLFHARRRLAGVSAPRQAAHVARSMRYHRQNAHFQPIHRLCEVLLSRSTLTFQGSPSVSFCAFAINVADLFERYVRRLFRLAFGADRVPLKRALSFPLGGTSHHISLDGLHLGETRRVIECKYRLVEDPNSLDFNEGAVPNAHLFQAVAYAAHESVRADEVLIVYPAVDVAEPVREVMRVSGFRAASGEALPVRIVLVSLNHPPAGIADALRAMLPP